MHIIKNFACQILLLILVCSGLKPKVLDMYKRLVVQAYGYEHLLTLQNLEKAGFITAHTAGTQKTFGTLRKRLNLISDIVDEQNPTDIAYVHSVYAPLSVRLVQQLEKPGWRNIRVILYLKIYYFHFTNILWTWQ